MMKDELRSVEHATRPQRAPGFPSNGQRRRERDTAEMPLPKNDFFREMWTTTDDVVWSSEQVKRIWKHTTG